MYLFLRFVEIFWVWYSFHFISSFMELEMLILQQYLMSPAGRWFSPGTPIKFDLHDISGIVLKVALNTITLTISPPLITPMDALVVCSVLTFMVLFYHCICPVDVLYPGRPCNRIFRIGSSARVRFSYVEMTIYCHIIIYICAVWLYHNNYT